MDEQKVEKGFCHCLCGSRTPIATRTRNGNVKGQPMRFIHGHSGKRETIQQSDIKQSQQMGIDHLNQSQIGGSEACNKSSSSDMQHTFKEEFERSVREGLKSKDKTIRETSMKLAGDMLLPTIAEAQARAKAAEARQEEAEAALNVAHERLAGRELYIELLRPLADRLPVAEAELNEAKATFNQRIADMRSELVAEAAQKLSMAERAEREASNKLRVAAESYSRGATMGTFDVLRKIVEDYKIPQPSFWDFPHEVTPAFWTIFGWSHEKAQVFSGFKKSYPTCDAYFKKKALDLMKAGLPSFGVEVQSDHKIENYAEQLEAARELAQRFKILDELIREVEKEHIYRAGIARQQSLLSLHAQEDDQIRQEISNRAREQDRYDDLGSPLRARPTQLAGLSRRYRRGILMILEIEFARKYSLWLDLHHVYIDRASDEEYEQRACKIKEAYNKTYGEGWANRALRFQPPIYFRYPYEYDILDGGLGEHVRAGIRAQATETYLRESRRNKDIALEYKEALARNSNFGLLDFVIKYISLLPDLLGETESDLKGFQQ